MWFNERFSSYGQPGREVPALTAIAYKRSRAWDHTRAAAIAVAAT